MTLSVLAAKTQAAGDNLKLVNGEWIGAAYAVFWRHCNRVLEDPQNAERLKHDKRDERERSDQGEAV